MGAAPLSPGNKRAHTAAANERAQPLSADSPSLRPGQLHGLSSDTLLCLFSLFRLLLLSEPWVRSGHEPAACRRRILLASFLSAETNVYQSPAPQVSPGVVATSRNSLVVPYKRHGARALPSRPFHGARTCASRVYLVCFCAFIRSAGLLCGARPICPARRL